jgi:hypothetical protein
MPREVRDLYLKLNPKQDSLDLNGYLNLLILLSNRYQRSFILVDALDELSSGEDGTPTLRIDEIVKHLYQFQQNSQSELGCSLFLTSREHVHVYIYPDDCTKVSISAATSDIELYVKDRMFDETKCRLAKELQKDRGLSGEIICTLLEKSQGM